MDDTSLNRYSMPVTRSRNYVPDSTADNGLDGNNTTGFLFGDEDSHPGEAKHYAQANNADNFPTLVRREGFPTMVSSVCFSLFLFCFTFLPGAMCEMFSCRRCVYLPAFLSYLLSGILVTIFSDLLWLFGSKNTDLPPRFVTSTRPCPHFTSAALNTNISLLPGAHFLCAALY